LQSKPSFGIYLAFSRLSFKSTGGNHGQRKESEKDYKASPQGFEAGRAKTAYENEHPNRIG
jgi:hypothetical protein